MKFKVLCISAAMAVASISTASVQAQVPARPPVQESATDARKLELTRRYIAAMMTDQFEEVIHALVADSVAMDPTVREIPERDREFLVSLSAELTADMLPRMLEEMAPVYARAFTVEELEALVAFYESDLGRSIASKSMAVMPEANRAAMNVMPALIDKMAARMCQHYGCAPGELEAMQREMRGESVAPAPAPTRK